jgi:hypothetical protein
MLGKLLKNETNFGTIDFNIHLDGINDNGNLEAAVSGAIDKVGVYGYDYSNIQLEGTFTNKKFDGSFYIDDPNIDLIFAGTVDFEKDTPAFDFTVDVANLRPYYLNLRDNDPEYFASFFLKTAMTGSRFDELNGQMQLVNSLFRRTGGQIQVYDLLLTTGNGPDSSFITLNSDLIDAEIKGQYTLPNLPEIFASILNDHFEIFPKFPSIIDTANSFVYNLELKDVNPLLKFFFPRFSIAKNINIGGFFQPVEDNYLFSCQASLPSFGFSELSSRNMEFSILSDSTRLTALISGDMISSKGGFEIKQPFIKATFANNANEIAIQWDNDSTPKYAGNILTNGKISHLSNRSPNYSMNLQPSNLFYDNRKFTLPRSSLNINSEGIAIDSFLIRGSDQYIIAHGSYTDRADDSITLSLDNLNLQMINDLSNDFLINIEGYLSGQMVLKKESDKPVFTSNLITEDCSVNGEVMGNISIIADWIRTTQQLKFKLISMGDVETHIDAGGYYDLKNEILDFDFNLSQVNLNALQPYLIGSIEEISGTTDINLSIDGTLKSPVINGIAKFNDASAMVTPTMTKYYFSDEVRLYKNDIYFDDFKIYDINDNSITARGNITTSNFKNMFLNLDISAENFNFLSTTRFDNEQFYGDIFASATAKVNGPINRLKIVASAISEKNTNLNLPLYNAIEIRSTDFITFINSNEVELQQKTEKEEQKNGITLDMDLEISSNTSVQLIFDPKVGDIIEASVNGKLKLELDEKGELSLFGDVLIQDGEYLFTLQNVINKRFRVKPGGTIAWNGSPTSATINLDAVYETKASARSLAPENLNYEKKRIPVLCLLSLQGDLTNPTIIPSINLPTAEPDVRSFVETIIGTDEELMRQFISLLIINNFINSAEFSPGSIGEFSSTGVAGVTSSEFLSNQLSNLLSQLSNDFDIGINYRPGDEVSIEEVEVALSTQFLNDRIILSGNLEVLGDEIKTPSGDASTIVGDFDLEFMVTDKISLKAFNRVNDDYIIRNSFHTQGVGVLYRSEFNKVSEIFRRNKEKNSNQKEQKTIEDNAVLKEEEQEIQKKKP